MAVVKYRVHDVAKDFNLQNKDIMELLKDRFGKERNHMAALETEELNYIFEVLSQKNSVSSFDAYFKAGEEARSNTEAAKRARAEKERAEALAAEAKAREKAAAEAELTKQRIREEAAAAIAAKRAREAAADEKAAPAKAPVAAVPAAAEPQKPALQAEREGGEPRPRSERAPASERAREDAPAPRPTQERVPAQGSGLRPNTNQRPAGAPAQGSGLRPN
ncbi:MAG: translation initiation factor IF-2 N-terminal domain-containing protein, partial [Clostridia bacterium]|nr:translation initiation factor IF-2 N-terminal domain-containing protein [Clostridia bacterium]